jgi:molybdopterin-containing oxidoreductase family membrane subunit
MNYILLILLALGLVIGGKSIYQYLTIGHSLVNFNSAVPWGLWVSVYIWLIGISAGTYLIVMLWKSTNNERLSKITGPALLLSLVTLPVGLLSIQLDLGHIERFYKLFLRPNPSSVMAWMVFVYGVYFVMLLITLVLNFLKKIPKSFCWIAVIFAAVVIFLESMLFALPPGKHWHTIIFPLHFFITSIISGTSFLVFLAGVIKRDSEAISSLSKFVLWLLVVNLAVEIVDSIFGGGFSNLKIMYLLLGNIVPVLLLLTPIEVLKILAGLIAGVGTLATKYNSLVSAQLKQPFKGFEKSFIEPGLVFKYIPSATEWLVVIFLISLSITMFYILYKILPVKE